MEAKTTLKTLAGSTNSNSRYKIIVYIGFGVAQVVDTLDLAEVNHPLANSLFLETDSNRAAEAVGEHGSSAPKGKERPSLLAFLLI